MAFYSNYSFLIVAALCILTAFISSTNKNELHDMSAPTSASYLASLATRRSIYSLTKTLPAGVTQSKIQEIVNEVSTVYNHILHHISVSVGRMMALLGQVRTRAEDEVELNIPMLLAS